MSNANFPFFFVFVKLVPSVTMTPDSFSLPEMTFPVTFLACAKLQNTSNAAAKAMIFFISINVYFPAFLISDLYFTG